jgi:SPP1 family phage portal protein
LILYIDRSEVPDVEDISPEVLRWCVQKAEAANGRYDRLNDYYLGKHPVLVGGKKDDVKVAVNYAKYVVDITRGYYLGVGVKYDANDRQSHGTEPKAAGDVETAGTLAQGEAIDLSPLLACYDAQQIGKVDSKIGKRMGVFGDCLELCYASSDEEPSPRSACIDPRSGVLVRDTSVEHNKLFALLWEKRERTNGSTYYHVTVYTDRTIRSYEAESLTAASFKGVNDPEEHFFGAVPVIAYENNDERQGDFEQIIPMIDAYNGLMSNRFTDKKKFVNALLVFYGMTLGEGDQKVIAEEKTLDGVPIDARVEYIQKTFDEAGVQVLADTTVREIHKMTLTVDMSDEKFSGNSSGQALKLKLLTMNLLVKNKIQQMEEGLKERLALYNNWLVTASRMKPFSVTDVDVRFTVSTPINEAELVQLVTQLQGIVDDQTLLSQLWFIKDPAEAVENVRRQKEENIRRQRDANMAGFGKGTHDEEDEAERKVRPFLTDDE